MPATKKDATLLPNAHGETEASDVCSILCRHQKVRRPQPRVGSYDALHLSRRLGELLVAGDADGLKEGVVDDAHLYIGWGRPTGEKMV